jgi:formate--tetrahydrofolate ligase
MKEPYKRLEGWQLAEALQSGMPSPDRWRDRMGLERDEVIPMWRVCKLNFLKIMRRLEDRPDGKYIT